MFGRAEDDLPVTLADMERAANQRYAAGEALLRAGEYADCIYLLGYAAEIVLKIAYLRLSGKVRPEYNVLSGLKQANIVASANIPGVDDESSHSLRFWAMLIEAVRRARNDALPAEFALEYEERTERLHNHWWVQMRYRQTTPEAWQARAFFEDVSWLRHHQEQLWR